MTEGKTVMRTDAKISTMQKKAKWNQRNSLGTGETQIY